MRRLRLGASFPAYCKENKLTTETELAYAAGVLDGEGSVCLIKSRKGRLPSPQVSIVSTDRELAYWFKTRFSGTVVRKRKRKAHHSDAYDWRLIDRNALRFLALARPFLTLERKIARGDLLLNEYLDATPRNGRYDQETMKRKQALIEKFSSLP